MPQTESTPGPLKGKHLTYKELEQIETLRSFDKPMSGNKIADKLGCARKTIYTEIKDGTISKKDENHRVTYCIGTILREERAPLLKKYTDHLEDCIKSYRLRHDWQKILMLIDNFIQEE